MGPRRESSLLSDESFACIVVVPVHNRPTTIRRAVLSALEPRPAPKVVVVDDDSDDYTVAQLDDIRSRLQVIRSPDCAGPSTARNLGVEVAVGEWLLFLDSDGLLMLGAIALAGGGSGDEL